MTGNKRRRRRRRKTKRLMLLITAAVVILILALGIAILCKRFAPSKTVTDLAAYYNLTADLDTDRDEAASDEAAIVFDDTILEERGLIREGQAYVRLSLLTDNVDERLYYDSNEKLMIISNAVESIKVSPEQTYYTVDGDEVDSTSEDFGYTILTEYNDTVYVALEFACEFSDASYSVCEDPKRIVITYKTGERTYCDALKNTQIRVRGGIKSEIVGTVSKGEKLLVLEDLEDWINVVSSAGWVGYIKAGAVGDIYTETVTGDYDEPEYTSLNMGKTVKLGWAPVYVSSANSYYSEYTEAAGDALNVYCPTWYSLADGQGGVTMRSDSTYVSAAHDDGYLVWALFDDTDAEIAEAVLTHTSIREKVTESVINDVLSKGIDGINIDFERINSSYGADYIQFIRELSIRCREEGIYLSVDNYAPYEYNACYHMEEQNRLCDYVMLMAYDDYLGTGEAGPSASLEFVRETVELSLEKVDASKLVVAMPFYSRLWTTDSNGELDREEYSMVSAWQRISDANVMAHWDETLGLWYAQYESDQGTVDAWLEDVDTIEAKMDLISTYNVAGYAFWRLGQEYSTIWDVIGRY